MPQIYEAELSDGRIVEFESDHEPTEADVLAAIQAPAPAPIQPTPAETTVDPRRSELESQMREARAEGIGGKALETLAGFGEQAAAAVAAMPGAPLEVAHRLVPTQPLISPEQGEAAARFFNPFPAPEGSLVRGIERGVGGLISGITDPLALGQILVAKKWPQVAAKPIAKGFQAQMMLGVPQAAQEVAKAQTPEELGVSGIGLGASAGFPLLIEAQLRKSAATLPASAKAASEAGTKKGVQDATQERIVAEGRQPEYPRTEEVGVSAEAGSRNRPVPTAGLEEKAQIPLTADQVTIDVKEYPDGFKVQGLSVPPSLRGRRLGTAEMQKVIERSNATEKPIFLTAHGESAEMQPKLNAFYERLGFKQYRTDPLSGKPMYRYDPPIKAVSEAKATPLKLTPEESAYLEAERSAIDVPVEVSDVTPEGQPFAGDISVADRPNQRIIINPQGFSGWLAKVPTARRAKAVRSLLGEERIHLAVDDPSAQAYWDTLTAVEKAINRRRYTGNWRGINVTAGEAVPDLMIGHEALRFRMQQLARTTPREIAETDFLTREGFTVRSITAIENALRVVRETFGTKASQEGLAIIERIQGNLDAAKAIYATGASQRATEQGFYQSDNATLIGPGPFAIRKVYHGSPHEFERFDLEKIGTGEGAQVYGWGLYFAEKQEVAQKYAESTYKPERIRQLERIRDEIKGDIERQSTRRLGPFQTAEAYKLNESQLKDYQRQLKSIEAEIAAQGTGRQMYVSDLEIEPSEIFDYDATVSPQLLQRMADLWPKFTKGAKLIWPLADFKQWGAGYQVEGGTLLNQLSQRLTPENASAFLSELGFKAIRYFDQGSRVRSGLFHPTEESARRAATSPEDTIRQNPNGSWEVVPKRTYNYVVFDDSRIKITDRNGQQINPAAIRKGKPEPKEQEALDLAPVKAGEAVERAGAGYIPPKATELESLAARHFDRAIAAGEIPDFQKFKLEVGEALPKASLYYLWQDAMMKRLVTAKGEQVAKLMSQLGVTRDVAQALHPGESAPKLGGSIPDPQIFTRGQQIVMPSLGKIAKAQYARQMMPEQRRRHAALGAVMDKLMEQAGEKPVKPWTRTGIGPEDIMQRYNVLSPASPAEVAKVGVEGVQAPEIESRPMFRTFTPSEAAIPTVVGDIATTGAAVEATGKGAPPRTVSRNLVALKDASGKIVLVSAWRDPRTGPKVTNPLGASFPGEKIDSTLLRKWKPVAVMSLRDPVQNYRDVFASQEAFDAYFGDIGIEGSEGLKAGWMGPKFEDQQKMAPPAGVPLMQGGPRGEPLPIEQLTGGEFVSPTAKELTMPVERIPPTVVRGEQLPKGPGPEPTLPAPRPPEMLPEMPPYAEGEVGRSTMAAPSYGKPTGRIVEYGKPMPIQPGTLTRMGLERGLGKNPRMPAAISKQDLKDFGGSLVTKVLVNPIRLYSEWMPERLARAAMEAGDPKNPRLFTISEAFKDAANIIIDQEKKNYGSLVDVLDPAKKAAGQFGKDTTWANKPRPITPKAATRNAVDAVEGTIPVPAFAKKLIDLARAANLRIGQLLEKYIPGFIASNKWQRNLTGLGYDIMRQGSGEAWNDWVFGTAKANYKPTYVDAKGKTHRSPPFTQFVEIVKKIFREYKAVLDDPMSDTATIEKVNQDFVRVLPQAITDIKIMGQWQPVIHGNLFNYLENAARRATHATAFREVFPLQARGAYRKMMEAMRAELPGQFHKDLDALNRALQGHPTDSYADIPLIGPGEPIGEAFRFLNNTLGNFFSKLVLSGQMAVQMGEVMSGSSPVFLGYNNFLRAVARLKHAYGALEQTGQVNRVMYDMSWDPASPVRSAFRIGGNVISRTFMEQFSNELQELHAATTATVVTERIKAGALDAWEKRMLPQTFKAMGFSEPQVGEMMKGNPELLGQFERKAAAFLTSGNKAIAEGSRMGANRMFNSIFRFQTYPMMKLNQFRNVTGNMAEAWQKGTPAQKRASTEMFARFLFGNTVQGILTVGVTSLLYEGVFGTGIRANEAKDEFGNFMLDSFLATVGGPLYLLWRGARDQGAAGIGKQLERTIFPMTVANELIDFAYGTGAYRDRDGFDRIWRFMQQKLPATKAISQGLSMAGLSIEDKKLDASILAFYRWRRKELGWTDYEPFFREDERRQFRMTMRAAVDAMKRGDSDTYVQKLGEATALQGRKSVKSSLQARRLLQSPTGKDLTPEQLDKLRAHIGDAAVEKLQGFDAMLKALAR